MTDKPQVGLKRWCEAFIDGDISAGQFKRAIRIWHNKQMSELLDRLAIEVRASDYIGIAETIQSERNKLTMANSPQLDNRKEAEL